MTTTDKRTRPTPAKPDIKFGKGTVLALLPASDARHLSRIREGASRRTCCDRDRFGTEWGERNRMSAHSRALGSATAFTEACCLHTAYNGLVAGSNAAGPTKHSVSCSQ
jgi:hypothetical protein